MNPENSTNGRDDSEFVLQWAHWHQDHERRRASPHGFLSITGLHWLTDVPQRFDDVPGEWSNSLEGVEVLLLDDEELIVDGHRIGGQFRFDNVDEQGIRASFSDAIIEVARRDGHVMIRPRDPNNSVRMGYAGTPTYPPSTDWLATGQLVNDVEPRLITVDATVEGLTHVYKSPGEIVFNLSGQELRLVAFNGEKADELFIVFTDMTSGNTSYPACRFLDVDAPDVNGSVTLDFNRATNPPCAYSHFATCPLPPTGNDLPVRIEAGEKNPLDRP